MDIITVIKTHSFRRIQSRLETDFGGHTLLLEHIFHIVRYLKGNSDHKRVAPHRDDRCTNLNKDLSIVRKVVLPATYT